MKIGINVSNLNKLSSSRGIGFYTQNLISSLKEYTSEEVIIIDQENKLPKVDIIHYPFFDFFKHTLPYFKKFPTVVTIHDVTPLLFPASYPKGIKGGVHLSLQKLALKNVSGVITDSISSKNDIVKILKIKKEKVYPIYLAADESFKVIENIKLKTEVSKKYKLTEMFILYIGDVNWNKNLINLTKAAIGSGVDIFFVGKAFEDRSNLNHPERQSFREFLNTYADNPKVHMLGFVPSKDLVIIMNLGSLLLLTSFYEGFGLPILEAQSCGLPVITSNISSMPEVGGEGVLLVDPYSSEEISSKINFLLNNETERKKLINRGFENIKKFSWRRTAQNTLKVYEKILS